MIVKELMQKLSVFPEDMVVKMNCQSEGFYVVEDVDEYVEMDAKDN